MRSIRDAGVQPWPERHVCSDGKVRSLSVFVESEWLDHPEVRRPWPGYLPGDGRGGQLVWMSHRIRAARSLGRDPIAIASKMAGRGPRKNTPFH